MTLDILQIYYITFIKLTNVLLIQKKKKITFIYNYAVEIF